MKIIPNCFLIPIILEYCVIINLYNADILVLFGINQLALPAGCQVITQAYYGSIGYSLPAALGAAIAQPDRRVMLFIGDGAFQVTAQELSTLVRHQCNVKVFIINNKGYTIERIILDGVFNDIQNWHYHRLSEIFGGPKGVATSSPEELVLALEDMDKEDGLHIIEVACDTFDTPKGMRSIIPTMPAIDSTLGEAS